MASRLLELYLVSLLVDLHINTTWLELFVCNMSAGFLFPRKRFYGKVEFLGMNLKFPKFKFEPLDQFGNWIYLL